MQHDAVSVIEHALALRGFDRPGDVIETPWTIGYVQKWLRRTKARRQGRDYSRTVLATLVEMELLRDTGKVLTPRRQPSHLRSRWWRVFEVVPVVRARDRSNHWKGAYANTPEPARRVTGSLCRFLRRKGLLSPAPSLAEGRFSGCLPTVALPDESVLATAYESTKVARFHHAWHPPADFTTKAPLTTSGSSTPRRQSSPATSWPLLTRFSASSASLRIRQARPWTCL